MHRLREIVLTPALASIVCRSALLVAVTASAGAFGYADEPNDTLATATTVDALEILTKRESARVVCPTMIEGVIGDGRFAARDVDLFRLVFAEQTPPFLLTVGARTGDAFFDPFLRLFDSDGVELANNDDRAPGDMNPRMLAQLPGPGTYFVGVSVADNPRYDPVVGGSGRSGAGGPYSLTLAAEERTDPSSPREPNDRTIDATFAGSKSFTIKGELIGDGEHARLDVDIYELRVTGAAKIDVELRAEAIGSVLDPVVRMRNCEDPIETRTRVDPCLLGAGDHLPDGSRGVAFSVGVLKAQTVFIMVSGAGNRRYNPATAGSGEPGSTGVYDLAVTVDYFDPLGPNEPNDSISTATKGPVFVDGRPTLFEVDGFLGDGPMAPFQGDRDFYDVIIVDEPRMLTIDVTASSMGSSLDPVVSVYDWAGNELATSDRHNGTGDGHIRVLASCFAVGDDSVSVFVMVSGTRQRPPRDVRRPFPDQTIVLSDHVEDGPGSVGPYHLSIKADPIETACGSDPGDTLDTAAVTGIIDQGEFACTDGFLGDSSCNDGLNDLDLWAIDVTHPPVVLAVTPSLCSFDAAESTDLVILDPSGETLAFQHVQRNHFFTLPRPLPLRTVLTTPGRYYVALAGNFFTFDVTTACSGVTNEHGRYHLIMTLTPDRTRSAAGGEATGLMDRESTAPSVLFATRLDGVGNRIDAIDSETGESLRELPTPEPRFGGSEGLAFDGDNLYYVGVGRFPKMYRLDPLTGTVLDEHVLWMGSGFYSDAVLLGGELFFLDYGERSIHVLDPLSLRHMRTLDVGGLNRVTIAGGLGALAKPSRLYAADAFNTRRIYELDPNSGMVTNELGPFNRRPAAVGGVGDLLLYVSDSDSPEIDVLLRDGSLVQRLEGSAPVGTAGGEAFSSFFADFDGDGDVDLIDHAAFQRCFGDVIPPDPACPRGDRDNDGRIDLIDYSRFLESSTGP